MNLTQHASAGDFANHPPDTLTWVVSPTPRIRKRLPVIVAVLTMTSLCALILFHSVLFALVSVAVVLVPNLSGLISLTYKLSPKGARVCAGPITWLEMAWADVHCVSCIKGGIKLSAFYNPATAVLESRRGIQLIYPTEMADEVEETVTRLRALAKASEEVHE